MAKKALPITAVAAVLLIATSFTQAEEKKPEADQTNTSGLVLLSYPAKTDTSHEFSRTTFNSEPQISIEWENVEPIETEPVQLWTDEELEALVRTIRGECYDDKPECKRKVCETICNRVSHGSFGDSIVEVVTAPNQFAGYWAPSRPATENDYEIARQTLEDWYANDCEALSEWLYFVAGENRENVFRSEY